MSALRRLRDRYVAALAAESGAWAFVRWFAAGLVLQVLFMIPLMPLVLSALMLPDDLQPLVGSAAFFAAFLAVRVLLFALPCAEAGELKRRGSRTLWLACGVVFGMFALGAVAALEPRPAPRR